MYDNLTRTNLEFAHREAEKRIADLEKEYASLKGLRKYELNVAKLEIEKLEKENAGLKAGRPKWHKVVDGDLPKENNLYLVAIKDNGLAIAYFNGLHWETKFNLGDFGHCLETVIAWCEIPEYTEE